MLRRSPIEASQATPRYGTSSTGLVPQGRRSAGRERHRVARRGCGAGAASTPRREMISAGRPLVQLRRVIAGDLENRTRPRDTRTRATVGKSGCQSLEKIANSESWLTTRSLACRRFAPFLPHVPAQQGNQTVMSSSRDPLSKYPAIHTSCAEEFEHVLVDTYGVKGFDLDDPAGLCARGNFVRLRDTCLGFSAAGVSSKYHFEESDFARLQFSLSGHGVTRCGNRTVEVGVGRPCIASAGQPAMLHYGADFEHLFLRVKSDALDRKLAALLGTPIRHRLEFALSDFS